MQQRKTKIMVYGTFDVLHLGHVDFLRQAKALGDFLVVSVARDVNAKKFKGYAPVFGEKERLQNAIDLSIRLCHQKSLRVSWKMNLLTNNLT